MPRLFLLPLWFWSICTMMNSGRPFTNEDGEQMINACDHVFDCIEMGQGYHFHQGQVYQHIWIEKNTSPPEIRWPLQADSMTLTTWPYGDIMAKTWTTHRFGKFWICTKNINQPNLGGEQCMPTRTPLRRHISMTGIKMELLATTQVLCRQYPGGKWAM